MSRILTIDQGTTSSRSIIFDINGDIEQVAQEEYQLIFPNDGWVEIDPEVLYKSVTNTLNQLDLEGVKFGGITNQRETTIIWDKNTLELKCILIPYYGCFSLVSYTSEFYAL